MCFGDRRREAGQRECVDGLLYAFTWCFPISLPLPSTVASAPSCSPGPAVRARKLLQERGIGGLYAGSFVSALLSVKPAIQLATFEASSAAKPQASKDPTESPDLGLQQLSVSSDVGASAPRRSHLGSRAIFAHIASLSARAASRLEESGQAAL